MLAVSDKSFIFSYNFVLPARTLWHFYIWCRSKNIFHNPTIFVISPRIFTIILHAHNHFAFSHILMSSPSHKYFASKRKIHSLTSHNSNWGYNSINIRNKLIYLGVKRTTRQNSITRSRLERYLYVLLLRCDNPIILDCVYEHGELRDAEHQWRCPPNR